MRNHYLLCALSLLLGFTACENKPQQSETTTSVAMRKSQNHVMGIYDLTDTIGNYVYTLHREPTDSLPAVKDEYGDVYVDNCFELTVSRAGSQFFRREFTKRSFKGHLAEGFEKNAIFDGFRFTRLEDGKLYFSVCVSYPDSDLSQPFILCVASDGSYTIEPDNNPDFEE